MLLCLSKKLFIVLLIAILSPSLMAENQQQKIKKKIAQASSNLSTAQTKSNKLRKQVNSLEKNLSDISKAQYRTERNMEKLGKKLGKASHEKQQLLESITQQKEALAQQIQALYTSGEQSHLRLLLKQDDPSDIGRTIKYFEYLNRSRLKKIKTIRSSLKKVQTMEQKITVDRSKLKTLNTKLSSQKLNLKGILKKRERSLKKAKKQVVNKASTLKKLKVQEARLKSVITNLIAKEKRAKKSQKTKTAAVRTPKKKEKKTAKGKIVKQSKFVSSRPFSSLRGRLSWPVRGRMVHTYGSKRNDKQRWKGVVITAPGGRKVRTVARGKVEFSGRLNGYGYLIIIRHDKNYRSLYAYNRSIYKKEGDIVNAGEVIAAVGNSGGQEQNALYFEIRKGTRLQNPSRWCR
ncbi:MAG TPA: peptidase M23 [Leucothrix mucor]|nr:peptidase M23 [Leucothrix mucor]